MSWKLFGVLLLAKFCGEQFSNADNGSGAAHAERSKKILSIVLMCGRAYIGKEK